MYLINHIILPPRLPQGSDEDPENEAVLIETTLKTLQSFSHGVPAADQAVILPVSGMISNIQAVRGEDGSLREDGIIHALRRLRSKGKDISPISYRP